MDKKGPSNPESDLQRAAEQFDESLNPKMMESLMTGAEDDYVYEEFPAATNPENQDITSYSHRYFDMLESHNRTPNKTTPCSQINSFMTTLSAISPHREIAQLADELQIGFEKLIISPKSEAENKGKESENKLEETKDIGNHDKGKDRDKNNKKKKSKKVAKTSTLEDDTSNVMGSSDLLSQVNTLLKEAGYDIYFMFENQKLHLRNSESDHVNNEKEVLTENASQHLPPTTYEERELEPINIDDFQKNLDRSALDYISTKGVLVYDLYLGRAVKLKNLSVFNSIRCANIPETTLLQERDIWSKLTFLKSQKCVKSKYLLKV